jgi:hypothetical protein
MPPSGAVSAATGTDLSQLLYGSSGQPLTQDQANAVDTSGVSVPSNPLDLLGSMSPYGVGTAGEQLTAERNAAIAAGNPLRDVPLVGGLTTLLAQMGLDPTSWAGAGGEEAATHLGGEALGGGLGLLDLLSSPEIAYASTSRSPGAERILNEAGQLLSTAGAPASTIYQAATGTDMLARALSGLEQLPAEQAAPLRQTVQDLIDQGQPSSQIASQLMKLTGQLTGTDAAREAAASAPATVAPAATTTEELIARLADLQKQVENAPPTAAQALADLGKAVATPAAETATGGTPSAAEAARIAEAIDRGEIPATGPGGTGGGAGGGGTSGLPPLQQGGITTLQAGSGNLFSTIGQYIASALSPTENLDAGAASSLSRFANLVGRNSDAITGEAAKFARQNGLSEAGQTLIRNQLYGDATRQLVKELQSQGLITRLDNRNLPAGWKVATSNAKSALANYAVHPDIAGPLKAVIERSAIATNPLGNRLLQAWGSTKQTIFSLSQMHTLTEGLNAAFSGPETFKNYLHAFVSPSFVDGVRSGTMEDTFINAAKAGVTKLWPRAEQTDVGMTLKNPVVRRAVQGAVGGAGGFGAGYTSAKQAGLSDEDAVKAGLATGGAGAILGGIPLGSRGTVAEMEMRALWNRAVPMAKVTAWDGLVQGGMDAQAAARVVNQRFGGLNYAAMGRSPTVQDAMRLGINAPDWLESTIRQIGGTVGGAGAGENRAFLARTLGGMMMATEAANYALTGHSTLQNQPGHQFEIEHEDPAGGYMHMGILPANIQSFLNLGSKIQGTPSRTSADLANFVTARLPAPVATLANVLETAKATNPSQLPYGVAKAGPAALLAAASPVGPSQVAEGMLQGGIDPKLAAAMAVLGLNPTYANPSAPGGAATGGTSPGGAPPRAPAASRTPPRPKAPPRAR